MDIKIRGVLERKTNDERLVLDVINDCRLGRFVVIDTTYDENGSVSNKNRHMYLFSTQTVKKGDLVVLYTKKGDNTSRKNINGSISYFYFWGLDSTVWNNEGDEASLLHIDAFERKKV